MSAGRRIILVVGVLLALAAPALAAGGGGGSALVGFGVVCAIALILALPLAVVVRATCAFPQRVSAALTERAHRKRFVGIASLICVLAFMNVGKFHVSLLVMALIAGLAMTAALLGGLISASHFLGRRLFRDPARGESVGAFVLGWLLLAGTTLFPIVGPLYVLYHMVWGAGAVLLGLFGKRQEDLAEPAEA